MKKYPYVKQNDLKDCGVASISMILKYYGGYVGSETLREMTKTTRNGTTAYHIKETLNNLGFEATGVKCKLNNITNENIILPCIANVTIDNSYKHFIVIYEINFKKKYLVIADPADKQKKISFEEFDNIFNEVLIIMYPIRKIIKEKSISLKSFILQTLVSHKKLLLNICILSIFITIFSIISSFYTEFMFNNIVFSKENLFLIFIVFFFINLLKIISDYFRNNVLIIINQRLDLTLTLDTFKNIISLPYHYFRNRTTGEVLSRINDLDIIRDVISKVTLSLFIDLPLTILSFVILYTLNSTLFFIGLLILLCYLIIIYIFKDIFYSNIKKIQEKKGISTSYMVESISGIESVKGMHLEQTILKKFENRYVDFLKNIFKYQKNYFLQKALKDFIDDIGFIVIIFIGCILVIEGKFEIASLITFTTLLSYFLEPIKNIISLDTNLKEAKSALIRVLELKMDNENNGIIDRKIKGDIEIKNLSYSFNDRENILNNINLKIKRGSKTMIIGKSGSGKSTLLKILMKYYKVQNNHIFIDNIDINNYNIESINNGILLLSQKETLFTDTVYNNLIMKDSDADSLFEISDICEIGDLLDPNLGYNTLIEEDGFNFSGGEKQRLILCRTLLRKFEILLIDEGLNQVDISMERKIIKKMFKKFKDKTIIYISHRVDNLDLFDNLIHIERGTLKLNETRNGKY